MKKFLLSLLVMFVGLPVFATEETLDLNGVSTALDEGTGTPAYITWTAADGNITIQQLMGPSDGTPVNGTYSTAKKPPRLYANHILSFVADGQYRITSIELTYSTTFAGNSIVAGTSIREDMMVTANNAVKATISTTSGGTHTFTTDENGLSEIDIQNGSASGAANQLRLTAIKITYFVAKKPFEAKTIASIDELENNVAYSIHNVNGMGYLVYDPAFAGVTVAGVTNPGSGRVCADPSYEAAVDLTSANAAWQLVKYEDSHYLYNIGAKKYAYFSTADNYYKFSDEPVAGELKDNGDGTFGFRTTNSNTQYLCINVTNNPPARWWTYDDAGSVMQIETVDIDVDDIYETVEAAAEQAKRNSAMAEAIAEAETAYAENFTWGEGLITSADQLSSPYTEPTEGSLAELLDGNQSTFWHSIWSGSMEGTHYLQIELPEAMEGTFEAIIGRRSGAANDHITTMIVKYVIDDVEYDAATLDLPFGSNTETLVRTFNLPTAAKTIRLYNGGTTSGNAYWHMGEFQLKAATAESKNLQKSAVAVALQTAIDAAKALANATQEDIDALQAAIKRYNATILPDVEAGTYVIAATNTEGTVRAALAIVESKTYDYIQAEDALAYNGTVYVSDVANAFTFTAAEDGFTIQNGDGRYLYATKKTNGNWYNNFNLSTTLPATGAIWYATQNEDGTVNIVNALNFQTVQYDEQFSNFAQYEEVTCVLPVLYSKFEANPTFDVTVYECEAEMDHWTTTNSDTFHRNTWSGENDESGMKTPFIEAWRGTGNNLNDATISHTQLTGLDAGKYTVTIFARMFNEGNTTDYPSGVTLFANDGTTDLTTGKTSLFNGASTVLYDNYSVDCTVGEEGTLDLGFTLESVVGDWLAFKNVKVVFHNPEAPELVAVEGKMNADVAAAQAAALEAYKNAPVPAAYADAAAAVAAAQASADYYAGISAVVENLDEAGKAVFAATENGAAYEASTLTNEDVTADLVAAQKAQTTAGSDMSLVAQTTVWTCPQGNGPGVYNANGKQYTETYNVAANVEGKVMYQHIEGLTRGTYNVTFLATANMAWIGAATGTGIAQIYANDVAEDIEVIGQTGCNPEDYVRSLDVTVGEDGVLEYGMQNIATGGNWYVAKAVSLTLVEKYVPRLEKTIDVERETGMGYTAQKVEVDLAEAKEFLGVDELTTSMLRIVNPDGTQISDYATYDGWFATDGTATVWNTLNGGVAGVCVKFFQALDGGQFDICDMSGADVVDATYSFKWALVNGETEVVYTINVKFVEPVKKSFDIVKTIEITHEEKAAIAYNEEEPAPTFDVAEVCEALGVDALDAEGVETYIVNVTDGSFVANSTDGWRDANGDACQWSKAENGFCLKLDDPTSGEFNYTGAHDANFVAGDTYVAKWGITYDGKAVVLEVTVKFVTVVGINSVDADQNEAKVIFDLSGRRLTKAVKGVNIINGKKVLVK